LTGFNTIYYDFLIIWLVAYFLLGHPVYSRNARC